MPFLPFTIIDVFSTTPYKGNPLAIVDATSSQPELTDTQLKLITRQFNLSETTFFFPPTSPPAHYKLRSFLPDGEEVFGAGHNILGVWCYLAHANLLDLSSPHHTNQNGDDEFTFHQELGGKVTPVRISRSKSNKLSIEVAIRQASPKAHAIHPDPASLAASFGLSAHEIRFSEKKTRNLPPQVMSTSATRHLLVPVSSVEALNRAVVQRDKLLEQLRLVDDKAYGLYLFTPVASADDVLTFQARFFSPGMSGEDPATGSAAGPLARYLYDHGVLGVDEKGVGRIVVNQGLRVGRECVIRVELVKGEEEVEVDIIGRGVKVGKGEIEVPGRDTAF